MIDSIQLSDLNVVLKDFFMLFTDGCEINRFIKFSNLVLIKKVDILDGDKRVGSLEVQGASRLDTDYVRLAYQAYDSPIKDLLGERSFMLGIDFSIKSFTILEYLDRMVNSDTTLKAMRYKYSQLTGLSSDTAEEIKDGEDAFNDIEGLLKKLCGYELLVNTDSSIVKYDSLSPLEYYLALAVAKDLQGFYNYYS